MKKSMLRSAHITFFYRNYLTRRGFKQAFCDETDHHAEANAAVSAHLPLATESLPPSPSSSSSSSSSSSVNVTLPLPDSQEIDDVQGSSTKTRMPLPSREGIAKSSDACSHHKDGPISHLQSSELRNGFCNENELLDSPDPMLICSFLNLHGWGLRAEASLRQLEGNITPDLAALVVNNLNNAKVSLSFLEWAGKQDNYKHSEEVFTKIVARLGREGNFTTGWRALVFMRKHGLKVDYAFGVLINRLKGAGMVKEMIEALDHMKSLDIIPTVSFYTIALQLSFSLKDVSAAQHIYQQMCQNGLQPDHKLYEVLILGCCRVEKLEDGLTFLEEMKHRGFTAGSLVYSRLIQLCSLARNYSDGEKLHKERIQLDLLPRHFTSLELPCVICGTNITEQINLFLRILDAKGHSISIHTFNNMLQYLLNSGKFSEAIELFHKASGELQIYDDNSELVTKSNTKPYLNSHALLISGLCQGGKVVDALQIFREMSLKDFKLSIASWSCDHLMIGLIDTGMMDEAFEVCAYIVKHKVSLGLLAQRTLFTALYAAGHLSEGLALFEKLRWRECIDPSSNFHSLIGMDIQELNS